MLRVKNIQEALLRLGFKKKQCDCLSKYIFVHKRKRIVVKCPYISPYSTPDKEDIVPLVSFSRKNGSVWFIQPLVKVDKKSRDKAFFRLNGKYHFANVDLHVNNVGMYRNKAVLIDW